MSHSDSSAAFVESLEKYWGPWRGSNVKSELAKWIQSQGITADRLRALYRYLRDTRPIEPVNTISVVDLRKALIDMPRQTPRYPQLTDGSVSMSEHLAELFRRAADNSNVKKQEER